MGADIHGWVEVRHDDRQAWDAVVRIRYLVERAYRVFAFLFGLRNSYGFAPLAADRGWPVGIAPETTIDIAGGEVAPTWVLWSEIKTRDWQVIPARLPDIYPKYHARLHYPMPNGNAPLTRAEILPPGWEALCQMMEALAVVYGDARVRLVVWFDQE